jgi:hypothetical protein
MTPGERWEGIVAAWIGLERRWWLLQDDFIENPQEDRIDVVGAISHDSLRQASTKQKNMLASSSL